MTDTDLGEVFAALGGVLQRHSAVTLVVALLVILVALTGVTQIASVTGDRAFTGEDPTLARYQETFDRGTIAVLVRGDVSNPETMRAIAQFDDRVSQVEYVTTVATPADQVRERYGTVPDSRARIADVVGTPDSTIVQVVLEPDLIEEEERQVYQRTVEASEWVRFSAGIDVTVTGSPAFSAQLSELIQRSTRQLLGLAVGLMVVALFLFFRGVHLRLLPIVAVFVGVVYTFGAMGFVGIPNSTLTSAVFPILIGLGIDYSVQFHQRYEEELDRRPPREALPRALRGIGPAVLIAMLAAALGFGATWTSTLGSPAFVWFAQTSILGILLTFATALIVLLPARTLYARWRGGNWDKDAGESENDSPGTEPATDSGRVGRTLGRGSRTLASHPALVLGVAGLLMVGGFYAGTTLDTLGDTEDFVPQDLPALLDLQQFRSLTGGGSAARFDILVTGDGLRDPETLRWMERFHETAVGQPLIRGVNSPATMVKEANGGRIPETRAGVERVLEDLPQDQRERFYSGGHARIEVIAAEDMTSRQTIAFIENTRRAIEFSRPPPAIDAKLTGSSVLSASAITDRIEARNQTTVLGVVFVFVALLVYYRDLVRATAPLVPMLLVVGWQNLYMAALGIAVSPLGASLGALTVGIGAEYTIIVMERFFEEKAAGASRLDAVEVATSRVGKAISVSGMTTLFGFSALILSPFPILSDFGGLTVGVIFLTLMAALTTLPPTLIVLDELDEAIELGLTARFGGGT